VGIEVEATTRWRPEHGAALLELLDAGWIDCAFAVYLGAEPLRQGAIDILPVHRFAAELASGAVLG
jgi:hypothetical protein